MAETKATRQYKCYVCGKKFNSITELARHDLKLDYRKNRMNRSAHQ
jgi:hypothetical protein